jgi:hypothetical protein
LIRQHFPSQCGSENPLRPPVAVEAHIPQLSAIVFEELAALGNEQLLLFGATSFVSELSESTITCQQVNVSRIVDFAIWSAEFFCGVGERTK